MAKNNKSITEDRLKKTLGEFTEEVLLPSMQEIFVTKDDLDKKLELTEERLDGKLDKKLDKKLKLLRDEIVSGQDKICKQLSDLHDEEKAEIEAYKRHDKKLENHEERIVTLETKVV